MYSEFIGITPDVASLIEARRRLPEETKCDILRRALSAPPSEERPTPRPVPPMLDLGQGASLRVGERIHLFLNDEAKRAKRPHASAEVGPHGLILEGVAIEPSRGSYLHPAMKRVQERLGHRNDDGEIISLSAWRQWHAVRDEKLVPLSELKDPRLARKRGRSLQGATLDLTGIDL